MNILFLLYIFLFSTTDTNCKTGFNINLISGLFAKQGLRKNEKRAEKMTDKEGKFLIEEDLKKNEEKYFSYNNIYNRNTGGMQFDFSFKNYFSAGLNVFKMNDSREKVLICHKNDPTLKSNMFCYLYRENILYTGPYISFLIKNLLYINFTTGFTYNENKIVGKMLNEREENNNHYFSKVIGGHFFFNFIFSIGLKVLSSVIFCINIGISKTLEGSFTIDDKQICSIDPYHITIGFSIIIEQNYSSKHTLSLGSLKSLQL